MPVCGFLFFCFFRRKQILNFPQDAPFFFDTIYVCVSVFGGGYKLAMTEKNVEWG